MKWGHHKPQNEHNSNIKNEKKKLSKEQKVAIGMVAATAAIAVIGGLYIYKN